MKGKLKIIPVETGNADSSPPFSPTSPSSKMKMETFSSLDGSSADDSIIKRLKEKKVSKLNLAQDLMALSFILLDISVIPFHIGFEFNPYPTALELANRSRYDIFSVINICADIFFMLTFNQRRLESNAIVDSVLSSLKDSSSKTLIMDKIAIYKWGGYGSSRTFFFAVLSFLPIDIFDYFFGYEIFFFRIFKLLRLFILPVNTQYIQAFLVQHSIEINQNRLRLARDLVSVLYIAHAFGCMFMLIAHCECGFPLGAEPCESSWALVDNLQYASTVRQWLRAFYWGIMTTIPLGGGDIIPKTDYEVLFTMLLFFCGVMIQNQLISNFCFYFSISDKLRTEFDRKQEDINRFMENRKVPDDLKRRVNAYLEYSWDSLRGLDESKVINSLPPHLRRDAMHTVTSNTVGQVPFWRGRSDAFLNSLTHHLKIVAYSPRDSIVTQGNTGRLLYIVKAGQADKYEKNSKVGTLDEGNVFGELALFEENYVREYTVKARTFCELYTLDGASLDKALKNLYGEDAADHRALIGEKAIAGNKSKGKMKKMLGDDEEEQAALRNNSKNKWKLPNSTFRKIWDFTGLFIFIYYLIEIPVNVAFLQEDWRHFYNGEFNYKDYLLPQFTIDMIMSIFNIVDVILHASYFSYVETSHTGLKITVLDQEKIWSHYRKHSFIVDFISSVPFVLLGFAINSVTMIGLSILRFVRLFKVGKYWDLIKDSMEEYFGVRITTGTSRITLLLAQIVALAHWFGCCFFFIGYLYLNDDNAPVFELYNSTQVDYGSITLAQCEVTASCNWLVLDKSAQKEVIYQFLESIYWSVSILTTVGYGNVKPVTSFETLFASLWIFISCCYFYFFLGLISSYMESLNAASNNQEDKMDSINKYMKHMKLPKTLRSQVRNYFKHLWQLQRGIDEHEILGMLPQSLHEAITSFMYEKVIQNINLFEECNVEFIRSLISKLQQQIYLTGDYIVRDGDMGDQMFIINTGRVEILAADKQTSINTLNDGNFFGEASFFLQLRRTVFVQAVSMCNISQLSKRSFEEISLNFPGHYDMVVAKAGKQRERNKDMNLKLAANLACSKLKRLIDPKEGLFVKKIMSRYFVFTPDSNFRNFWDMFILCVIFGTLFYLPFRLAYFTSAIDNDRIGLFIAMDAIVDIIFMIDVYLKLTRFAFMEDGEVINELRKFLRKYNVDGWLIYDIIACFPLYYPNALVQTILRFPKAVKFLQVPGYFDDIQDFILSKFSTFNSKWLRVFKLLIFFLCFAHYFGCMFYFISLVQVNNGVLEAWILHDEVYGDDVSLGRKYSRSLYWALESLTLGCHGDILALNVPEIVMSILCALAGFVVVSTVIGNISDLLATLDKTASIAQARMDNFLQFASKQDLPNDLRENTMLYYEFKNSYLHGIDINGVYEMMPNSFKTQIARQLYGDILERTHIFEGCNSGLISSITMLLKPQLFTPSDYIINQGDMGSEMFIVSYGNCEVISVVDQCVYAVLSTNEVCGEISFFLPKVRRTASVRAVNYCELLAISKKDWDILSDGMTDLQNLIESKVKSLFDLYKICHLNIKDNMTKALNDEKSKLFKIITDQKALVTVKDKLIHHQKIGKSRSGSFFNRSFSNMAENSSKVIAAPLSPKGNASKSAIEFSQKDSLLDLKKPEIKKSKSENKGDGGIGFSVGEDRKINRRKSLERRNNRRKSEATQLEDKELEATRVIIAGSEMELADFMNTSLPLSTPESPTMAQLTPLTSKLKNSEGSPNQTPTKGNRRLSSVALIKETMSKHQALKLIIETVPPHKWALPNSNFRYLWDIIFLLITIYYVIVIPFRICFIPDGETEWVGIGTFSAKWIQYERVTDIFYLLNILLRFRYFAFYDSSLGIVTNFREIAINYINTQLILDFFVLLPIDYLSPIFGFDALAIKSITWLRINKLGYALRLNDYFNKLTSFISSRGVSVRPSTLRFGIFVFYFLLFVHWVGCIYYYSGMSSGAYGSYVNGNYGNTLQGDGGWMSLEGSMFNADETIASVTLWRSYLRSVYFSLGTIITVNYGDIKVLTITETLVVIFVIISACFLLSSLIGVHRASLTDVYKARSLFLENLELTMWLLKNRKFDNDLLRRIKSYYHNLWERNKGMDSTDILSDLTTSLRTEISLYINTEIIEKVDLFENCEQAFVDLIALVLKPQLLEVGDFAIREGELGNEMYFVNSGVLRVFNNARTFSAKKRFGDCFGEIALLLDAPRNANVQADTDCDLLMFTRGDYESILEIYPEYRERNRKKWIKPSHMAAKRVVSDEGLLENFRKNVKKMMFANIFSGKRQGSSGENQNEGGPVDQAVTAAAGEEGVHIKGSSLLKLIKKKKNNPEVEKLLDKEKKSHSPSKVSTPGVIVPNLTLGEDAVKEAPEVLLTDKLIVKKSVTNMNESVRMEAAITGGTSSPLPRRSPRDISLAPTLNPTESLYPADYHPKQAPQRRLSRVDVKVLKLSAEEEGLNDALYKEFGIPPPEEVKEYIASHKHGSQSGSLIVTNGDQEDLRKSRNKII